MRKIIEYTLVSADGAIGDAQNWGVGNFQDDAYLRDGALDRFRAPIPRAA